MHLIFDGTIDMILSKKNGTIQLNYPASSLLFAATFFFPISLLIFNMFVLESKILEAVFLRKCRCIVRLVFLNRKKHRKKECFAYFPLIESLQDQWGEQRRAPALVKQKSPKFARNVNPKDRCNESDFTLCCFTVDIVSTCRIPNALER